MYFPTKYFVWPPPFPINPDRIVLEIQSKKQIKYGKKENMETYFSYTT